MEIFGFGVVRAYVLLHTENRQIVAMLVKFEEKRERIPFANTNLHTLRNKWGQSNQNSMLSCPHLFCVLLIPS